MKRVMCLTLKRSLALVLIVMLSLLVLSCSLKSNEPNPATPEGRFELAKKEFAAGRFEKAAGYAAKILKDTPNHELAASAALLEMTVYAGLAEGYREVAKTYIDGRNFTRDVRVKNEFRNRAFDVYKSEKAYALTFFESFEAFAKKMDKGKALTFQVNYPQAEAGPRLAYEKVAKGILISDEEHFKDQEETLRNGVWMALTSFVGAGGDRAKAKTLLAAGNVTVTPGEFLLAVAQFYHRQEPLFDRMALNEAQNFKAFCEHTNDTVVQSIEALKAGGDKKSLDEALQLKKECDANMKKLKKA
ncbi:MAG: hypothetical protein PHX83_10795 [Acidobacteriia bacterium]|nr:hypothetical protein [Terriglobia bacterium]